MRDELTPEDQAWLRREEGREVVYLAVTALLLSVAIALAWLLFVQPPAWGQTETTEPRHVLDCPAYPHGPARSGGYVQANFSVSCPRSGHDITSIVAVVRFDVAYGGSWHRYGPGRRKASAGGSIAFLPFRNVCDVGAGGYPMRQRSVVRVEGFLVGPDYPHPEPFTYRRIHVARSDGRIGCGRHTP
jgi:hypothetical protein